MIEFLHPTGAVATVAATGDGRAGETQDRQ